MDKWIKDITLTISQETIVHPDDPPFCCNKIRSLDAGDKYELRQLLFCNHIGTHIDFPLHIYPEGRSSSDYDIKDLIGKTLILQIPVDKKSITKDDVKNIEVNDVDFVFFKTGNSDLLLKKNKICENFVYLEKEAAEELTKKNLKGVGIDYISVDQYGDENMPIHRALLSSNILIIEGLELSFVHPAKYQAYIIPLKIPNMDGLPARVFIEKVGGTLK